MIFVVDFTNPDAVNLPITIKLTYPDLLTPDTTLGEAPLRFLQWHTDCYVENGKGYWEVQDPSYNKTLTSTSVELYIYETGLYAFGADYMDYHFDDGNRPPFIPGYPMMIFLPAVGICSALLMLKIKSKRR